jgi:hypothetical protein
MPDAPDMGDEGGGGHGSWQIYVRRHLPPLQVAAEREADIVDELALQLEQACHDAVAGGASQREARERVLAGLPPWEELAREIDEAHFQSGRSGRSDRQGPSARRRQRARPAPRAAPLSGMLRDVRHALRLLRIRPAFAGVALATLAFGIGINAAVFTLIDAVELRGLPFPAAGRLMAIETRLVRQPEEEPWTSAEDFFDLRERARSFSRVAAISPVWNVVLTGTAEAQRLAPMRELMARSTAQRRFLMWLLTVFAVAALLLAAVGVYGIVAESVAQRTREIGLRMALGARPAAALRLLALDGLSSLLPGMALGLAGAAGLTRTMRSVLFEVAPLDPVVFGAAAAALGLCGALACYLPARRATRIDPLAALRQELAQAHWPQCTPSGVLDLDVRS